MKIVIFSLLFGLSSLADVRVHAETDEASATLEKITNFHFVSPQLASSGMLDLAQYSAIQQAGFKHVINLIPGMQLKERRVVESLGMSYEQIPVVWEKTTLDDFQRFVALMKSYGDDKVYVHCQLNWRASTFVYLYRVTQLGVEPATADKDLAAIWSPHDGWENFIPQVIAAYSH